MRTKDAIRLTLIDLMDERNISGKDLADAVGVTKQAVSSWRTGKSSIDIDNVPAICEFFGISFDEFFGDPVVDNVQTPLDQDEVKLIEFFRSTNSNGKSVLLNLASDLSKKFPDVE